MSELSEPELPEFLSVVQSADALRITERAVRHRIKAGTLAATKLGPGTAAYVIAREEIQRVQAEEKAHREGASA